MKSKTTVAMLLLTMFALSSIAMIQIKPVKAVGTLTLSDAELMLPNVPPPTVDGFYVQWAYDGAVFSGKTDISGPGVQFDFTGLGKIGMGDKFVLSALAGGIGTDNADFTAFSQYSMLFINLGPDLIEAHLLMNTGFNSVEPKNDTFWASSWVSIPAHTSLVLTLDFSSCGQIYNAMDDPEPTYRHPDGSGGWPVQRLGEVTNIGFEIANFAGGSKAASVVVSGTLTHLYIDPPETTTPDSFFDVYVTLSAFTNLAGFDIQLTWDSTRITKSAVDYATYCTALWGAEGSKWNKVFESSHAGDYELAVTALAASASNTGASYLFKVTFHVEKTCNFPLSTAITFTVTKLSDNTTPVPNPIPATITNGLFTSTFTTRPDITFKVLKKIPKGTGTYQPVTPPYNLEYCDMFEVEVYVSHIHDCSPLTDYDVTINFGDELVEYVGVDVWGIFGADNAIATYTAGTPSTVHVTDFGPNTPWFGEEGLLFTLTFHVEFAPTPEHIWKFGNANHMIFDVWLNDVTLSFGALGNIPMSGIDTPLPLSFDVFFIRGDVNCDGNVHILDIAAVAPLYNHPATEKEEYDLNDDGTIDIFDIVTIATNYGYGMP